MTGCVTEMLHLHNGTENNTMGKYNSRNMLLVTVTLLCEIRFSLSKFSNCKHNDIAHEVIERQRQTKNSKM